MNYCIINGKKSTLIKGLLIQSLPPISKPLMRTSIEEIDGRDGDVVTYLGYQAYDKPMTIGLFGDYDIDEIISFFNSSGTVTFSNEPAKYYNFEIIAKIDFERLAKFKTATVTFHTQPYKFSAVDDAVSFTNDEMAIRIYHEEQNGVTVSCQNNVISVEGTATISTEFYVPLNKMTLEPGAYTLNAITTGSNASACAIRVIENNISAAETFGGQELTLATGTESLSATIYVEKTYNYIWVHINSGQTVDIDAKIEMIKQDFSHFSVFNRGNEVSRPIITIYGAGNIRLSINSVELYLIALGDSGYITLDGEQMNAYKGETLMNRLVQGDYDRLNLKQGTNVISWLGNVTKVSMDKISRWV